MKRSRWTPDSPHKALNIALASATLLSIAAVPSLAAGAVGDATPSTNGVYVTILSPNPGTSLTGAAQIEISAYYESSYGVSSIDLFIDGRRMATQRLNSPEGRGEISFMVDPSTLHGGSHTIVVRATATDAEVASARTMLNLPGFAGSGFSAQSVQTPAATGSAGAGATDSLSGPSIDVLTPGKESTVSGIVRIKVNATDPSGKSPYVSLFVDHAFKTLRNFPPYTFDWDTTRLPNGYHTIEVLGYNDAQQVGQAAPVRVMVNNPGGRTFERHDLLDTPSPAASKPVTVAAKQAASSAKAKSPKISAAKSTAQKGLPSIAHAVRKSIAGLISRADKLASIDSESAPLGAASVDEALFSPVLENQTAPQAAESAKMHNPTLKLSVKAVVKPAYKISSIGRPTLTNSAFLPVGAKLDTLPASDLSDLAYADISAPISAPTISLRSSTPPSHTPLARMASADTGENSALIGQNPISTPHVDVARIAARAAQEMPTIDSHSVTLGQLTQADIQNVRGEYQVVVDNQRVELDRPMQDRGSVLFAPLRQIFESQGGQLSWDHVKRQVRAVNQDTDILVTIGSKKAVVNNQSVRMNGAPYLFNSRTMLPIDFFAVAMNARVSYDATTGHMIIESR